MGHCRYTPDTLQIAVTNTLPVNRQDAQLGTDFVDYISLIHDIAQGADIMIWLWSDRLAANNAKNGWFRAFDPGTRETVPVKTLVDYNVPQNTPMYIQSSISGNAYVGGIRQADGRLYDK